MSEHYDYDAIIIGAGISGLVCGCYLAKAGLKTLIVEKNANPGGYCVSFKRDRFRFDAAVHSLSSFRKNGKLTKILDGLGLDLKTNIKKYSITDIIVTPEFKIKINSDPRITIDEFGTRFPKQKKAIVKFVNFILKTPVEELTKVRSKTLSDLLDAYFTDDKLKTVFATIILGLAGSPPNRISAFVSSLIYREFVFDGGYYSKGGMQEFSNMFVDKFNELGGEIIYSKKVEKISIINNRVTGIELNTGDKLTSRYVVSACDLKQTLNDLIVDSSKVYRNLLNKVNSLEVSYSAFLVYLGMSDDFMPSPELKSNIWVIKSFDMNEILSKMKSYDNIHVALTSPSCKENLTTNTTICLTTNTCNSDTVSWKNREFRDRLSRKLIELSKLSGIDIDRHVSLKLEATPDTLHKWTLNYGGAAYGWASTCDQFGDPDLSQKTLIDGLYITGHWSNESSGVTSVVNCGFIAANLIVHINKGNL